jgi:hypothetical protein
MSLRPRTGALRRLGRSVAVPGHSSVRLDEGLMKWESSQR